MFALLVGLHGIARLHLGLLQGFGFVGDANLFGGKLGPGGVDLGLTGGQVGLEFDTRTLGLLDFSASPGGGGALGLEFGALLFQDFLVGGQGGLALGHGGLGGGEFGAQGIEVLVGLGQIDRSFVGLLLLFVGFRDVRGEGGALGL